MVELLPKQGLHEPAIHGRLGFEKMIGSGALEYISDDFNKITGKSPQILNELIVKQIN